MMYSDLREIGVFGLFQALQKVLTIIFILQQIGFEKALFNPVRPDREISCQRPVRQPEP